MDNRTQGHTYERGRYAMAWTDEHIDSFSIMKAAKEIRNDIEDAGDDAGFILIGCHAPQLEDLVARIRDTIDMPEALAYERAVEDRSSQYDEEACQVCGLVESYIPDGGCGDAAGCPYGNLNRDTV